MTVGGYGRRTAILGAAVVALVGVLLVSVFVLVRDPAPDPVRPPTATPSVPAPQPPPDVTPPPVTGLKPLMTGLVDRKGLPDASVRGLIDHHVVNVTWAELQPYGPGQLADWTTVEEALETARALSAAEGTQLTLKMRVFAGADAPAWAKELGGAPLDLAEPTLGGRATVGRFWTDEFGAAYADLQRLLAERYDTVPEIVEVTASRCTTVFAEPMIRQASDPTNVRTMLDAGFTAEQDLTCLTEMLDAHQVWQHTRTGLALNPYQHISTTGIVVRETSTVEQVIQYCRDQLGPRCVLANNSIRTPLQTGPYDELYSLLETHGAPLTFQTARGAAVGDLESTLRWAVARGAAAVELPAGYATMVSQSVLEEIDAGLTINAAGV